MSKTIAKTALAVITPILVSACGGGGGVNSTPTPPPAPVPTPTPTPTPTSRNTSLNAPLVSETFVNDATTASGTFPTSSNLAAGPSTLTFSYDQSSQAYTVQTASRTQTFRPADKDPTQSSAAITTYKRVAGAITDLLTLTNPGSSGSLRYTYVGGGFWQRSVQGASTVDGTFDSFTYGVKTPDTAVPRSGSATYDLDLLGVLARASGGAPYGMSGTGQMTVDFSTNGFSGGGTADLTDPFSGTLAERNPFTLNGTVSASANALSGAFVYDPQGNRYVGGLTGRFFGPAADEFGAAVSATPQNQAFPGALTAALLGRKSAGGPVTSLSLLNLATDQTFIPQASVFRTYIDPATGAGTHGIADEGAALLSLRYVAATKTYELGRNDFGFLVANTFSQAQIAASQPDPRFTEYRSGTGADAAVLRLFKPGSTNTDIVLTYSSFGTWDRVPNPQIPGDQQKRVYFAYGLQSTAFPRTGTASYTGKLYGSAGSSQPNTPLYELTGTVGFTVDFAADTVNGTLSPVGRNLTTGASTAFGTYVMLGRGPLAGGTYFDGSLRLNTVDPSLTSGWFRGTFFGPAINEAAGGFFIREADAAFPGQSFYMTGAFVSKKN